jgi:uncharacterized repeat protein (TIGR03806 family)
MGDAEPASLLSQTGCVNMAAPAEPLPGFIPYTVRSPLWSDAAEKHRFLRLPSGGKIKVLNCATQAAACTEDSVNGDDGHWEVPMGTVLDKNFSLHGKVIETRLEMRRSMTRWLFYSYEWNEAGTEATLLPDDATGKDRVIGAQTWHYPGRTQCPQCHTPGAGFSLGPNTSQMNADFPYADGAMNQVAKLQQLGAFESAPPMLPGYPDPADQTAPLEDRALSYLQTNCAICHRPTGEYNGMDMRWATAKAAGAIEGMQLCKIVERGGDKPEMPRYRVVPGQPAKSAMAYRMHALTEDRMPEIGSLVVDPVGVDLIDAWIQAMPASACPPQPEE